MYIYTHTPHIYGVCICVYVYIYIHIYKRVNLRINTQKWQSTFSRLPFKDTPTPTPTPTPTHTLCDYARDLCRLFNTCVCACQGEGQCVYVCSCVRSSRIKEFRGEKVIDFPLTCTPLQGSLHQNIGL